MLKAFIWTEENVGIENHEDMEDRKLLTIDNVQIVVFSEESVSISLCNDSCQGIRV